MLQQIFYTSIHIIFITPINANHLYNTAHTHSACNDIMQCKLTYTMSCHKLIDTVP